MPDCPQGERIPGENPPVTAIPYAQRAFLLPLALAIHMSNSRRAKNPKLRRPCSRKARGAPAFPCSPNVRERSAERRWCGTPHPVGPPRGRAGPSSGRELPVHDADRRAFRRSTAAFSFVLGTAFWKRTGAPIRTPLIPRGFPRFHPLHQPVAGRTHVVGPGGVSSLP